MKKVCDRHEIAYDVNKGCVYCTPIECEAKELELETVSKLPEKMVDLLSMVFNDPNEASAMMDEQFGTSWRNLNSEQLEKLLEKHYSVFEIDYADFATVTNE